MLINVNTGESIGKRFCPERIRTHKHSFYARGSDEPKSDIDVIAVIFTINNATDRKYSVPHI